MRSSWMTVASRAITWRRREAYLRELRLLGKRGRAVWARMSYSFVNSLHVSPKKIWGLEPAEWIRSERIPFYYKVKTRDVYSCKYVVRLNFNKRILPFTELTGESPDLVLLSKMHFEPPFAGERLVAVMTGEPSTTVYVLPVGVEGADGSESLCTDIAYHLLSLVSCGYVTF